MTPAPQIKQLLEKTQRCLSFASKHAADVTENQEAWEWVSIALGMALQASLIAALSGYETATPADVLDPSDPGADKHAPISLMLRRVRSADYLNPPEQLDLPLSVSKGAEKLLAYRNDVVHRPHVDLPEHIARYCGHTLSIIEHLTLIHPAFASAPHTIPLTHIADHIRNIRAQIDGPS